MMMQCGGLWLGYRAYDNPNSLNHAIATWQHVSNYDGIIYRGAYVTNDNDGVGLISLITLSQLTRGRRNAAETETYDEQIVYALPELLGAGPLRYDLPLGYIESPPRLRIIIVNSPKPHDARGYSHSQLLTLGYMNIDLRCEVIAIAKPESDSVATHPKYVDSDRCFLGGAYMDINFSLQRRNQIRRTEQQMHKTDHCSCEGNGSAITSRTITLVQAVLVLLFPIDLGPGCPEGAYELREFGPTKAITHIPVVEDSPPRPAFQSSREKKTYASREPAAWKLFRALVFDLAASSAKGRNLQVITGDQLVRSTWPSWSPFHVPEFWSGIALLILEASRLPVVPGRVSLTLGQLELYGVFPYPGDWEQ
ncbi:hypothetical protein EV424DRAFT_1341103 [Suillus variegatus]|nr:hypothetical protein EV424DRAFT_1341103 [Suillus variegatus]